MVWLLIGFAVLNATVAQALWPHWLHQNQKSDHWVAASATAVMFLACFVGSIGIAFYAGLMVPR